MSLNISLALASKINLLLNTDSNANMGKFVSFIPSTQKLEFDFNELNFFNTDEAITDVDANIIELNRSNFAGIVNLIPQDGIVFNPLDKGYLWDVFETIVKSNSITAVVELSAEEKQKLFEAQSFCTENFATYKSYKNALDQCQLDYNEAKCSVDNATGEEENELTAEWNEYKEKMLQERIAFAEIEVEITGKRTAILEALNTIANIQTKKGISALKTDLKTKLDLFSKAVPITAGSEYLYTDFSPLGSFNEHSPAWNEIELYETEIENLCKNANPTLVALYAAEMAVENIKSITFEYAVIAVVREWFSEPFLISSNWNFALPDTEIVSDGKVPASGQIPAYITKIVCVRKLTFTSKQIATKPEIIKASIFNAIRSKNDNQKNIVAVKDNRNKSNSLSAFAAFSIFGANKNKGVKSKIISTRVVTDHRTKTNELSKWRTKNIAKFIRLKPISKQPKAENNIKIEQPFNGIKFIAFECKRLAQSPNPDLELLWE